MLAQDDQPSHYYLENERRSIQNLVDTIHNLPPDTIVIWLDGDDWFMNGHCVGYVRKLYETRAPWLTYGQFRHASGIPGWASEWPEGAQPRHVPWFATHLRTFRAGLFQQIRVRDFLVPDWLNGPGWDDDLLVHPKDPEAWIQHAIDLPIMFSMLEMAGRDRTLFVNTLLCIYNDRNMGYQNDCLLGSPAWNEAVRFRGMKPYARLKEQPW